ncbi:Hypothetical protein R9X50_00708300 [Acrodontium crateriforme]|uniref:Mediator of RNA polymerase II transcription subunit 9 n=1 Tax=Acrodontium crateriforme TaxID=150365 RepID=A0AAQ3MAE3_9PEZI|nr:Hypothetical protein R9X50_00708300 [Acrodontium crateriforme]
MALPVSSAAPTPFVRTPAAGTPSANTALPRAELPPPQTFDILPPLHELLARIDHTSSINPSSSSSAPDAPLLSARYADLPPLDPKDLPTEAMALKSRIRGALRALSQLPDMDRDVEEQRAEINELEDRLRKQEDMVLRLGNLAEGIRVQLARPG